MGPAKDMMVFRTLDMVVDVVAVVSMEGMACEHFASRSEFIPETSLASVDGEVMALLETLEVAGGETMLQALSTRYLRLGFLQRSTPLRPMMMPTSMATMPMTIYSIVGLDMVVFGEKLEIVAVAVIAGG
jgi:hypothetical protein